MRFHCRLAHRRRVWHAHRRWHSTRTFLGRIFATAAAILIGAGVIALAPLASVPLGAQTLALPATAPDSLRVGQSVIVRPVARDVIGRPASVARVQAWATDTTVLRISYVTGGQRLTALRAGETAVLWRWQRVDGLNVEVVQSVRVYVPQLPVIDGELVGSAPCRTVTASGLGRVEADTAWFVRELPGLPTARYCVDERLVVEYDGELIPAEGALILDESAIAPDGSTTLRLYLPDSSAADSLVRWILPTSGEPVMLAALRDTIAALYGPAMLDTIAFSYPGGHEVRSVRADSLYAHAEGAVRETLNAIAARLAYPVASYEPLDRSFPMDSRWSVRVRAWRPGTQPFGVIVRRGAEQVRYDVTLTVAP